MSESATAPPNASTEWDEAKCKAALAHLEKLQEQARLPSPRFHYTLLTNPQLDDLRLVIPRIIQPLKNPHPTPAHLFEAFKQATHGATNDLNAFRAAWTGQETQEILQQARDSHKANPDLSARVNVPRYGWAEMGSAQNAADEQKNGVLT